MSAFEEKEKEKKGVYFVVQACCCPLRNLRDIKNKEAIPIFKFEYLGCRPRNGGRVWWASERPIKGRTSALGLEKKKKA